VLRPKKPMGEEKNQTIKRHLLFEYFVVISVDYNRK